MMADFDEYGVMQMSREVRDSVVDLLVDLAKANARIRELEADREILAKDVNYHNCNTCDRACEHRPAPGERVRSNCFKWEQYEPITVTHIKDGEQE